MPRLRSFRAAGIATLLAMAGVLSVQAQDRPDPGAAEVADEPRPEWPMRELAELAGIWDYNPEDSINIQTGRPEQSPRSATQRGGIGTVGVGGAADGRGGGGAGRGQGRSGGLNTGIGVGPTPAMQREARDLARDLLEIPEALQIAVSDEAVTFTDDLERERVYLINGSKQEHQLGASRFSARTTWSDGQLRKAIEGGFDFKMTETYFLSPDATRLFVIIRVGEPQRGRSRAGFNRVYDRVDPQP